MGDHDMPFRARITASVASATAGSRSGPDHPASASLALTLANPVKKLR
jgi:hypothetical protein